MTVKSRIHVAVRAGLLASTALFLAACEDGLELPFGTPGTSAASPTPAAASGAEPIVGRDVEAPEVFFAEGNGLWDGRPSLGGVWVAHPDAVDPERVLVTNAETGATVVGALFRRERDNPGPALQVSSDAASALNLVAGQPTNLTVVALIRQEAPAPLDLPPPPEAPVAEAIDPAPESAVPGAIASASLDAVAPAAAATTEVATETADIAAAALEAVIPAEAVAEAIAPADPAELITRASEAEPEGQILATLSLAPLAPPARLTPPAPAPAETATPPAAPVLEDLTDIASAGPAPVAEPAADPNDRPFIQIGIYSAEENAQTAADRLRTAGIVPTVYDQSTDERALWRVVVGPAPVRAERPALLDSVRGLGFEDAYFVTN